MNVEELKKLIGDDEFGLLEINSLEIDQVYEDGFARKIKIVHEILFSDRPNLFAGYLLDDNGRVIRNKYIPYEKYGILYIPSSHKRNAFNRLPGEQQEKYNLVIN